MEFAIVLNTPDKIAQITEDNIICVDGGYKHVKELNLFALIGDLDSLDEMPEGVEIIRHNPHKNQTDGELALYYAAKKGADQVTFYGGTGGRIDHVLGNFALLKLAYKLGIKAKIKDLSADIFYKTASFSMKSVVGTKISLIPSPRCLVSESYGLEYPLNNLLLTDDCSRGISNIVNESTFGAEIKSGSLFLIINK